MPLNDTERALLLACHSAVVQLRSRATLASPAEVAKVTDAVELVLIELCQGRADVDSLLLQSELASIARAWPDYDGHHLFALDIAGEQQRQRALFKQSLARALGELPAWAAARIDQADCDTLADYRERLVVALTERTVDLERLLG
jgi:hypothetical protein